MTTQAIPPRRSTTNGIAVVTQARGLPAVRLEPEFHRDYVNPHRCTFPAVQTGQRAGDGEQATTLVGMHSRFGRDGCAGLMLSLKPPPRLNLHDDDRPTIRVFADDVGLTGPKPDVAAENLVPLRA